MKTLVTAFLPFNKQDINYSSEVLKYIKKVDKIQLDVIYDKCYEDLTKVYDLNQYDLIIALGEARIRSELTLETTAYNSYKKIIDNSGKVIDREKIIDSGLESIQTNVDLNICEKHIKLSHDPGRYVCNNIYYHLLSNHQDKSLFIHIPECYNDEQKYQVYAKTINNLINELEGNL